MRKLLGGSFGIVLSIAVVATLTMMGSGQAVATFTWTKVPSGGGFEPGVDFSSTGRLFVNEPSGLGTQSKLWYADSVVNTQSFTRVNFGLPWSRLPGGGDSDVVMGHGSRVYFLDLWAGSNSVIRSDDNGATWTMGTPFTTLPLSDRQWIAVGPEVAGKDVVYAVYHGLIVPPQMFFARSRDSGVTWTDHVPIPSIGINSIPGQVVADDTGFVALDYVNGEKLMVVYSTDQGDNWSSVQVSGIGRTVFDRSIVSLARDPSNRSLHAVWVKKAQFKIVYSHSEDNAVTWSTPVELNATNGSRIYPWVAARNGKVAISWYDANVTGGTEPDNVSGVTEWRLKYTQSADGGLTFDPIVDASVGVVKRGIICTMGLDCDSGREVGDFHQLAIAADGMSYISYYSAVACPCGLVIAKQTS